MRIIAGRAGGTSIKGPPGRNTRPTSDRVKEALFSRLEHEGLLDGTRVLDLFAGSGALGLEAASRGAAHVVLVEKAASAVAVCRANVATLKLKDVVQVRAGSVASTLAQPPDQPYDLVLADPPYDLPDHEVDAVLAALAGNPVLGTGWLAPDALVVLERSSRSRPPQLPDGMTGEPRRYGETTLWFCEPEPAGSAGPATTV